MMTTRQIRWPGCFSLGGIRSKQPRHPVLYRQPDVLLPMALLDYDFPPVIILAVVRMPASICSSAVVVAA